MIDLNVYYNLGKYNFEWDEEKAEKNFKKHGIYFEDRYKIVGKVGKILTVIYTERGENYRIISARLANRQEQEDYYEQFYY